MLGWTQAFGSIGGVMVTGMYSLIVSHTASLPAIHGVHEPWRYTLMSGVIPAIPLIVVRPFLPESPVWREKKAAGTLRRPSVAALFAPEFRRTTIVTTIMFACSFGAAFGAIQQMPQQIAPGLSDVRTLPPAARQQAVAAVQWFQEMGGLVGRILLALLAVRIVSRRLLLWIFQVPGLVLLPLVFVWHRTSRSRGRNGESLPSRPVHRLAVQLLGELHPEGVSHVPARHRRELRAECRWTDDWHRGGTRDDIACRQHARYIAGPQMAYAAAFGRPPRLRHRLCRELLASGTGRMLE